MSRVVLGGASASICALGLLLGGSARAGEEALIDLDKATELATEVDGQMVKMRADLDQLGRGHGASRSSDPTRVERRLREAELQALLGDHLRASILLLDVVEDASLKGHPRYDDCLFLLAESLRKSQNYGGARGYHEELLTRSSGKRLEAVGLALLQIASATDKYEDVDRYVSRLRQAGTMTNPEVDYIYGKMLFKGAGSDPTRLGRALDVFAGIGPDALVSAQASYHAGVVLVQMGRYDDALKRFESTLGLVGSSAESAELRDLVHLSIGRLNQELGKVQQSAEAYQRIPQSSPYYADMLYEVAWAHVNSARLAKNAEEQQIALTRASQALELLMVIAPESRLYPQARILQGNLQIRLGAAEAAYDTFQSIVDRYGEAQARLAALVREERSPQRFFAQLVAGASERADTEGALPQVAAAWALEEPAIGQAVVMRQGLDDGSRFLAEGRELAETLDAALVGEQRFNIFPALKAARQKAVSIENRVVNASRQLVHLERQLSLPGLPPEQRALLEQARERAAGLEREIQALPADAGQVEGSRRALREEYLTVGRRAQLLRTRLNSLRAQLAASDVWLRDAGDELSPQVRASVTQGLGETRGEIAALEQRLAEAEKAIRVAAELAATGSGRARSQALRTQYDAAVAEQLQILRGGRPSLPGAVQALLARIDQQRGGLAALDTELRQVQATLEQQVFEQVDELRRAVAAEAQRLEKYQSEHVGLSGESGALLGPVAAQSLRSVAEQFKTLVLEADVGIIDVAWARKQAETDRLNTLIREQQGRSAEFDSGFGDALKE
jgi:hypothetical protein